MWISYEGLRILWAYFCCPDLRQPWTPSRMVKEIASSDAAPCCSLYWGQGSWVTGQYQLQVPLVTCLTQFLCCLSVQGSILWCPSLVFEVFTRSGMHSPFTHTPNTRCRILHAASWTGSLIKTGEQFKSQRRSKSFMMRLFVNKGGHALSFLRWHSVNLQPPGHLFSPRSRGDKEHFSSENLQGVGCS